MCYREGCPNHPARNLSSNGREVLAGLRDGQNLKSVEPTGRYVLVDGESTSGDYSTLTIRKLSQAGLIRYNPDETNWHLTPEGESTIGPKPDGRGVAKKTPESFIAVFEEFYERTTATTEWFKDAIKTAAINEGRPEDTTTLQSIGLENIIGLNTMLHQIAIREHQNNLRFQYLSKLVNNRIAVEPEYDSIAKILIRNGSEDGESDALFELSLRQLIEAFENGGVEKVIAHITEIHPGLMEIFSGNPDTILEGIEFGVGSYDPSIDSAVPADSSVAPDDLKRLNDLFSGIDLNKPCDSE